MYTCEYTTCSMVRPAFSTMDFTFSKLCRACASKVSGIFPSGPRAPWPETYRNSPAKMPGLYGPIGLAPSGNTTRLSLLPASKAHAAKRQIQADVFFTWQVYNGAELPDAPYNEYAMARLFLRH